MNSPYSFDERRGLTAINRHPAARRYPSAEDVEEALRAEDIFYAQDFDDDLLRCPQCGRAAECECDNCPFCKDGAPVESRQTPQRAKGATKRLLDEVLGSEPV